MKSNKLLMVIACAAFVLAAGVTTVVAAPLPDGTELRVTQGVGSAFNTPCATGSCFSMEVAEGQLTWTDFGPGTDGGFILGKDQVSGGQENAPSGAITTPGELSTAWFFFSNYGTFATTAFPGRSLPVGASTNLFDDDAAGCTLAGCVGKTELSAWYVCWNNGVYPMGSGYPCAGANCTVDQGNGISLDYYTIDPSEGGDWSLHHKWVVPIVDGTANSFAGVKFGVILRGTVSYSVCGLCNDNDVCTTDTCNEVTEECEYAPISCDDGNVCTDDAACDAVAGCTYTNNTATCDDGNTGTTGDVCSEGTCNGTTAIAPPTLVSPADGQGGFGSMVEFRWTKSDGAATYQFYNCANDPEVSCNPEAVTAQMNTKGMFYAGGAGLFLIGMTFIGGLRGRKMIALLFVMAVVFAGGTLISCGNSSDDATTTPVPADQVQHYATGLSANTTYYWKVSADDGLGSSATSTVRSFTTM